MPLICYIAFDANPTAHYAYKCGGLSPEPGKLVVIEIKDLRKKLVTCVAVSDKEDSKATKFIFATLQENTSNV